MKRTTFKNLTLPGSAFIMVFVITALLALIGLIFLLTSRVDKLSTSAIEENKQLDGAVDTVIAQISQQLFLDTPGVDPNGGSFEYYDYPDLQNRWLASLEPYEDVGGDYRWRQISDIYNKFGFINVPTQIIVDYQRGNEMGDSNSVLSFPADADGDGVSDSAWAEIPDMNTSKGDPIFAAVRVIDNSAMLNVNTDYKFDLTDPELQREDIDGSSQLQVNLLELSKRGSTAVPEGNLRESRNWPLSKSRNNYESNVIWKYGNPTGGYTPFDISDELKLRYRYILNYNDITTRIEELWENVYDQGPRVPLPTSNYPFNRWPDCVTFDAGDYNDYDFHHISTINNLDRIIDRFGRRMINVNRLDNFNPEDLRAYIYSGLSDAGVLEPSVASKKASQIAVNMKDFSDSDSDMTVYNFGFNYYGFERPCIFISELAHTYWVEPDPNDPCQPMGVHHSYSIELSKHFPATEGMQDRFELILQKPSWMGGAALHIGLADPNFVKFYKDKSKYYVIVFEDPNVPLLADVVAFIDSPADGEENVDPDVILSWPCPWFNPYNKLLGDCESSDFSYDVYFGTEYNDVRDADNTWTDEYKGRYYVRSYDPLGSLTQDVTYYWRIDDINSGDKVVFNGPVWSFTVGDPRPDINNIGVDDTAFVAGDNITIERFRPDGTHIIVDEAVVDANLVAVDEYNNVGKDNDIISYQREMSNGKFIKRLWCGPVGHTLGHYNRPAEIAFEGVDPIQVFFGHLNNIGELGKIFKEDMYSPELEESENLADLTEFDVRINVDNPIYQKLFNYLTVFDPNNYSHNNLNETRVKGRININTAPWYVIAQLPWVSQRFEWAESDPNRNLLAQAITDYRVNFGPFDSIGQLNNIPGMHYYFDGHDQFWFPDLSTGVRTRVDGYTDDFEERDLIFARISDLVTVRSDLFTAYILVRLGRTGPQKRVIAILDRSGVYLDPIDGQVKGNVKVRALYEVPDAR